VKKPRKSLADRILSAEKWKWQPNRRKWVDSVEFADCVGGAWWGVCVCRGRADVRLRAQRRFVEWRGFTANRLKTAFFFLLHDRVAGAWRGVSEPESVGHGVEAGFLSGEESGGGEASECVAVTGVSSDGEVNGFAHESEDNGMFTDVIAGTNGMVADFAGGAFSGSSFATVDVILLTHLFGDDASELECGAAGGIFFEAVVSFDDFDIDAIRVIAEDAGGFADEFHDEIHSGAHAWGHQHGCGLSGCEDGGAKIGGQTGGGDYEGYTAGFADGEHGFETGGCGKVNDDIDG
jgi:hypothetical protein